MELKDKFVSINIFCSLEKNLFSDVWKSSFFNEQSLKEHSS